jgi:hypothetical protein
MLRHGSSLSRVGASENPGAVQTSIFQDKGFEVTNAFPGAHQSAAFTVRWILQMLLYRLPEAERRQVAKMKVHELVLLDPLGPEWTHLVNALPEAAQSELACGNMLVGKKPGEPNETLNRDDPPILPNIPLAEAKLVSSGRPHGLLDWLRRR